VELSKIVFSESQATSTSATFDLDSWSKYFPTVDFQFLSVGMLDYTDASKSILWHGTKIYRLRFVSFLAEQCWKLAFKARKGFPALRSDSVRSIFLSDVEVNGRSYAEREFSVSQKDAAVAFAIAEAVVRHLDSLGYRFLDAVVPCVVGGQRMEHDLVAWKMGVAKKISVEVKRKRIKKPSKLLKKALEQAREKIHKLALSSEFGARVLVMVEYPGGPLENGWRALHCEHYTPAGGWESLPSGAALPLGPIVRPSVSGVKRPRETTSPRRGVDDTVSGVKRPRETTSPRKGGDDNADSGDALFVLIAGVKYVTLPWFLGEVASKSQLQTSLACCKDNRAELRHGDAKTLRASCLRKELLGAAEVRSSKQHYWVNTLCPKTKPERKGLQIKLIKQGQEPSSAKYLWSLTELRKCKDLRK